MVKYITAILFALMIATPAAAHEETEKDEIINKLLEAGAHSLIYELRGEEYGIYNENGRRRVSVIVGLSSPELQNYSIMIVFSEKADINLALMVFGFITRDARLVNWKMDEPWAYFIKQHGFSEISDIVFSSMNNPPITEIESMTSHFDLLYSLQNIRMEKPIKDQIINMCKNDIFFKEHRFKICKDTESY